MNKKGVTFLEMILVLVIIAIGAALAVPKLRMSVENREAKAVLETLRSISHAVRMYEVTKGGFPEGFNIHTLETETTGEAGTVTSYGTFYLNPREYAASPPYVYELSTKEEAVTITARKRDPVRTITLTQCANVKGKDGAVDDNKDFLDFTPEPGTC